ncbi:MAG: hypothetical protein KY475_13000 [Planctomycetes bacterium]|nr:hypothetical protein [Planctomycetota bacterium]
MASFYISCTTCKSRLKVRDESAVGEIHTCPRCGSMVMVTPPRPHQMAGGASDSSHDGIIAPAAAGAGGASSPLSFTFEDAAEMLAPAAAPPAATAGAPPKRINQWADTVEELPAQDASAGAASEPSAPASDAAWADTVDSESSEKIATERDELSDAAAEEHVEPPAPGEAWGAPAAPGWRQWAFLGGAAAMGVSLAVAVFGYAVFSANRSRTVNIAAKEPSTVAENIASDEEQPADPGSEESSEPPAPVTTEEPQPAAPPDDASESETSPPEKSTPDAENEEAPAEADPSPAAPERESPFESPAAEPEEGALAGGSDLFDKFGEFLGSSDLVSPLPSAAMPIEPEPTDPPVEPAPEGSSEPSAEVTPLPRPAPREVDVEARLADPIAGLEFDKVPLTDFLKVISDLSTIPISIQPEALAWRQLSPRSPVSVRQTETTVERALAAALAPLGLGFVADDGHLVIASHSARENPLRRLTHPVEDLTGGDSDRRKELADLIQRLVAPESWKPAGAGAAIAKDGGIEIEQSEAVHYRVIAFCESLRTARGLPPRTKFDAALFQPQVQQQAARKKLATPITLNFRQPSDLRTILAMFGEAAGVTILIDWQAAEEAGWPPGAQGSVVAGETPLGEALADLLAPMDLTYRVLDGATLEVTTPERLRTRIETEFYPVNELLSGETSPEALMDRIRNVFGPDRFGEGLAELHIDPQSKHLIAALPQPQQNELAAMLDEWRE